jgi:flagellar protein FliO/FliZ
METQSLLLAGLVLAGLCAALLLAPKVIRSFGFDPAMRPGRRLAVIEAAAIDPRRRLVLARCDGREVLLLVGGTTDQVVGWLPTPSANHGPRPAATALDDLA